MPFKAGPACPAALVQGSRCSAAAQDGWPQQSQQLRFRLAGPHKISGPFASLTACHGAAAAQNGLQLLPVTTSRGGKRRQYAWDGSCITTVNTDLLGEKYTPTARLLDHLSNLRRTVKASFVPRREDVTDDYWQWLRWRLGQRFCSAIVLNFATQSLLTAVGVGAQKALAASAAINWMLKDGISRLVRMSVATQWGDAFDSDLKRFRFSSSVLYSALLSCEFAAPFLPGQFLLLASISNVGRAVGLTTFVSTQPAFQQALCASGKMADLASKTQAQHMVMDTLALAVCSAANYILRHQEARRRLLPVLAFPLFSALDLFCIYKELKAVQLRTLNRERSEMVAQGWVDSGKIPQSSSVSEEERLLLPPRVCGGLLPLRLLPLERVVRDPGQLSDLMRRYNREPYMMAVQAPEKLPLPVELWDRVWCGYRTVPHIAVALADGASSLEVCQAVLQAAHLRRCVTDAVEKRAASATEPAGASGSGGGGGGASSGGGARQRRRGGGAVAAGGDGSSSNRGGSSICGCPSEARLQAALAGVGSLSPEELRRCADESLRLARRDAPRFFSEATAAGWRTHTLLLSPLEKSGYSLQ